MRLKKDIHQQIQKMNPADRQYVTNFFRYTFFMSTFGYTIFGNKPMSFETINMVSEPVLEDSADYMDIFHIFNRYKLKKCWEAWEKYSISFPMKGFSIITSKFSLDPDYLFVLIINHDHFIKVVKENIKDFQRVLNIDLSPEQILKEYLRGEGEIFTLINKHDGLFGTLLGYGRNNAWEYMRQGGGTQMAASFPFRPDEPKDTKHVLWPTFSVMEGTPETAFLRDSYEKQRQKINTIYQKENFLELTLMKVMGGNDWVSEVTL